MTCLLQEIAQEQITRVLLERLIVNRPHPWGLLITFIELIKVNAYSKYKSSINLIWSSLFIYLNAVCFMYRTLDTISGTVPSLGVHLKLKNCLSLFRDHVGAKSLLMKAWLAQEVCPKAPIEVKLYL